MDSIVRADTAEMGVLTNRLRVLAAAATLTAFAAFIPVLAAEPAPTGATAPRSIAIETPSGQATESVDDPRLGRASVAMPVDHGTREAQFEGPLLWSLLVTAKAVDPDQSRAHVHQFVTVTGSDGYFAVLAMGEISPAFEAKQVILADHVDGKPLEPGHLRLVLPAEHRGGRSVRDVVRITVLSAEPGAR